MLKTNHVALVLFCILFFGACQKDEVLAPLEKEVDISLIDNHLKFDSKESLEMMINKISQENITLEDIPKLEAFNKTKQRALKSTGVNIELEFDTLVPNENFRLLLNNEREFQVNNIFYKITPDGTYYCNEIYKDELRKYISQNANLNNKKTSLKSAREDDVINGKFFLRRTFEEDGPYSIGSGGSSYSSGSYTSKTLPPNFSNVNKTKFDAKTVAGKVIQSLVGRNIGHGRYWGRKRRVKVNFYSYDYVAYRETGIRTKFQKKNWIGWSGTRAPQMLIGWRNIMYSYKYRNGLKEFHDWEKNQTNTIDKTVNDKKWAIIRTRNQKAVDNILKEFYARTADGIARKGLALGVDQLKSIIRNQLNQYIAPQVNKVLLQLYDEANHKVYYIVSDNTKKGVDVKNLVHVFDKDDGLIITWSSTSEAWRDHSNWGIEKPASLKIESGSAYGMACYDKEWKGFEIIK